MKNGASSKIENAPFCFLKTHIGKYPLHSLIGEPCVDKLPKRVVCRNTGNSCRPTVDRNAGHDGVENEESGKYPCEDFSGAVRDLEDPFRHARINALDPEYAEQAPKKGVHKADTAVEIKRLCAVIPAAGAERHFLRP